MRSDLSSSTGKTCAALAVIVMMVVFLSIYKSNLCRVGVVEVEPHSQGPEGQTPENPGIDDTPPEVQRALTEQTMILKAISEDVDSVNQSLAEITVILKDEHSR